MKRIVISVTSDLSTDQRVLKVARSLYENGYNVLLVGRKLKNSLSLDVPYRFKRMKLLFNRSALFYAEYNIRLFFKLLFSRADIFLSNDTDTLLANYYASKIRRKKLIFDAHELFPEVPELANRPKVKQVWQRIEDRIFPEVKYSYTVCRSIADYYNDKYGMNMQVVRNIPYYRRNRNYKLKEQFAGKKIILYQGALNVGRGLEWIIDAMPYVQNAVLVVIGDGDIAEQLKNQVQALHLEEKVIFLGRVEGSKLHEYTPSADIGLCLLENKGLSYYYSLPNRIFDYMHAGVPVLATDFPEIAAIVGENKTGVLIDHYEPEYLASVMQDMLNNPMNTSDFDKLAQEYCWENEEKKLLSLISN
ncbi:glycosyltransferase [Paludibacteraceae bacterium OttesenSCG-928-F17]|nr:glycosyltransferase [Paludibacteraceae bacterium OttesenSCG-928-F17]